MHGKDMQNLMRVVVISILPICRCKHPMHTLCKIIHTQIPQVGRLIYIVPCFDVIIKGMLLLPLHFCKSFCYTA
jgi:hypothetical protein